MSEVKEITLIGDFRHQIKRHHSSIRLIQSIMQPGYIL